MSHALFMNKVTQKQLTVRFKRAGQLGEVPDLDFSSHLLEEFVLSVDLLVAKAARRDELKKPLQTVLWYATTAVAASAMKRWWFLCGCCSQDLDWLACIGLCNQKTFVVHVLPPEHAALKAGRGPVWKLQSRKVVCTRNPWTASWPLEMLHHWMMPVADMMEVKSRLRHIAHAKGVSKRESVVNYTWHIDLSCSDLNSPQ